MVITFLKTISSAWLTHILFTDKTLGPEPTKSSCMSPIISVRQSLTHFPFYHFFNFFLGSRSILTHLARNDWQFAWTLQLKTRSKFSSQVDVMKQTMFQLRESSELQIPQQNNWSKYRLSSRCWWHKQRQASVYTKSITKHCCWSWGKISVIITYIFSVQIHCIN